MSGVLPSVCFTCNDNLACLYLPYYAMMIKKYKGMKFGELNDRLGRESFGANDNRDIFEALGVTRICTRGALASSIPGDETIEAVYRIVGKIDLDESDVEYISPQMVERLQKIKVNGKT